MINPRLQHLLSFRSSIHSEASSSPQSEHSFIRSSLRHALPLCQRTFGSNLRLILVPTKELIGTGNKVFSHHHLPAQKI